MTKIKIFPKETKKNEFFDANGKIKNGSCIIAPTVCTCTKEHNGCFELYIELVISDSSTAKHLVCWNYIVAPVLGKWDDSGKASRKEQIFFIYSIEKSGSENGSVNFKLYALHNFYRNSFAFLRQDIWNTHHGNTARYCHEFLERICGGEFDIGKFGGNIRQFIISSDMRKTAAIMDDDGLLDRFGFEIHRDNFYISAHYTREFSSGSAAAPAFKLIHGKEISNIVETVDYSDTITDVDVLSDGENVEYLASLRAPFYKMGMPYRIIEPFHVSSYKYEWEWKDEAEKHFKEVSHPKYSCVVTLNPINGSPHYSELSGILNCDIDDIGIVYSSLLGTNVLQKVTRTVEDVLKGQYTEITLGNIMSSLAVSYNNAKTVGMQVYTEVKKNGGGFTADVTVSDGKNIIIVQSTPLIDNAAVNYDAIVNFGDSYEATMSSNINNSLEHRYAYNGTYKLNYNDCFDISESMILHYPDEIESGIVTGCAMAGAGMGDSADADNIIFHDGTMQIGQTYVENEFNKRDMSVGVFVSCSSITKITIPKSVRYIACCCFPYCYNLKEIFYNGTISEWQQIFQYSLEQDKKNGYNLDVWYHMYNVTVHCTDGDTIQQGEGGINPNYGV